MKYLQKYDGYIKESFFAKILYRLFGKYIDKNFGNNEKISGIAKRLGDERLALPELIQKGDIKSYNIAVRAYKHFYPKENLLEDCEFMLKKFQEDLWKNKENYDTLSDAIFNLNKFIEYYKDRVKFYGGDIHFNPLLNK